MIFFCVYSSHSKTYAHPLIIRPVTIDVMVDSVWHVQVVRSSKCDPWHHQHVIAYTNNPFAHFFLMFASPQKTNGENYRATLRFWFQDARNVDIYTSFVLHRFSFMICICHEPAQSLNIKVLNNRTVRSHISRSPVWTKIILALRLHHHGIAHMTS